MLSSAERQKRYRQSHPERVKRAKKLAPSYRAGRNRRNNRYNAQNKIIALSHYGPEGKLQCAWPGCPVNDIDMLSLDHENNDGNVARRLNRNDAGCNLYRKLKVAGFPAGYQTLCHNHQWKKELLRRRA